MTAANSSTSFPFPKIYNFPPFFTRQVNERTWHSQLMNWSSVILAYCRYYRIFTLDLSRTTSSEEDNAGELHLGNIDGELFCNKRINRSLKIETIEAVFVYMVETGVAAWLDSPPASKPILDGEDEGADNSYEQDYAHYEQPQQKSRKPSKNSTIVLFWRRPQEWATLISEWVDQTGQNGSVLTLYELVESAGIAGREFRGLHPAVLKAVVDVLVARGKAVIMRGDNGIVAGLKFV